MVVVVVVGVGVEVEVAAGRGSPGDWWSSAAAMVGGDEGICVEGELL